MGIDALDALREAIAGARARGYVGLKTIAAYRGGLDLDALPAPAAPTASKARRCEAVLLAALEANEATGDPLPVQVHTGFGDSDLLLPAARPGLLKPLIERFRATTFVLLHCYPFVREAGWLAHVYGNVFFDVSLTIPHVARPAAALYEALELAPVSKLLYASDASQTPELYLLGARWWREALAEVLPALLPDDARRPRRAAHDPPRERATRSTGSVEARTTSARSSCRSADRRTRSAAGADRSGPATGSAGIRFAGSSCRCPRARAGIPARRCRPRRSPSVRCARCASAST